jgi:hypothetical protein
METIMLDDIKGLKRNASIKFDKPAAELAKGSGGKVLAPGKYLAKITDAGIFAKENQDGNLTDRLVVEFVIVEASDEETTELVQGGEKRAFLALSGKAKWKAATLFVAALGEEIDDVGKCKELVDCKIVIEVSEKSYVKDGVTKMGDEITAFFDTSDWLFMEDESKAKPKTEKSEPKSEPKAKAKPKAKDDDDEDDFV